MFEWLFFWRDKSFCDREYNHTWGYWKQYRTGSRKDIIRQTRFCQVCNYCDDQLVTMFGEQKEDGEDVPTTNSN